MISQMSKYRNLDFDKKQHRDGFSTAFNMESKYISRQFRMENIPVFSFDKNKFLPPKIQIQSKILQPQQQQNLLTDDQKIYNLPKSYNRFNKLQNQTTDNLHSVYAQIQQNRSESPLHVQSSPIQKQNKLRRYISVPNAIYAIPRSESSMSVRCYNNTK